MNVEGVKSLTSYVIDLYSSSYPLGHAFLNLRKEAQASLAESIPCSLFLFYRTVAETPVEKKEGGNPNC